MIQKFFTINDSYQAEIQVWGKAELESLGSVTKENLNIEIQKLVSDRLSISVDNVYILNQTHGDIFWNAEEMISRVTLDGDAIYTVQSNTVLIIKTADCMPIFFWSTERPLVGIIHSGWKGTQLGITEKVFLHLKSLGYSLDSIQAYLGPCARKRNYEVGEDLFQIFKEYSDAIEENKNNKYNLGIDLVLKRRLIENKLPLNLFDSEICTMENYSYYSHRRKELGRNINIIAMRSVFQDK